MCARGEVHEGKLILRERSMLSRSVSLKQEIMVLENGSAEVCGHTYNYTIFC